MACKELTWYMWRQRGACNQIAALLPRLVAVIACPAQPRSQRDHFTDCSADVCFLTAVSLLIIHSPPTNHRVLPRYAACPSHSLAGNNSPSILRRHNSTHSLPLFYFLIPFSCQLRNVRNRIPVSWLLRVCLFQCSRLSGS